ncbi:MAG: AbrB/MazE/SpoVT family DNA-binding domain-containing protein [Hyphomicrobiales bacterium]|nr:AbrB/MazE/SpoVT family DNA-binding domain-containing protein [Hyphomicrobiales bacterium]
MLTSTLRSVGGSVMLTIPKAVLDVLGLGVNDKVTAACRWRAAADRGAAAPEIRAGGPAGSMRLERRAIERGACMGCS